MRGPKGGAADAVTIALVQLELKTVREDLTHIRGVVDKLNGDMVKIPILDVRHQETEAAVTRAFSEIEKYDKRISGVGKTADETEKLARKWINLGVGFACACTLFAGLFSYITIQRMFIYESTTATVALHELRISAVEKTLSAKEGEKK